MVHVEVLGCSKRGPELPAYLNVLDKVPTVKTPHATELKDCTCIFSGITYIRSRVSCTHEARRTGQARPFLLLFRRRCTVVRCVRSLRSQPTNECPIM